MTSSQAEQSLKAIQNNLSPILAGNAPRVLAEAIAGITATATRSTQGFRRNPKEYHHWGYNIAPDSPLEFRDCNIDGLNCRVDISCKVFWLPNQSNCSEQNIVLRIWSLDKNMCYRSNWDCPNIDSQLGNSPRRVMLRYHFDLANQNQVGPKYHLQFGGLTQPNELFWFPDAFNLPRIAYPPIDIVLACEMVAANFFPDDYRRIRSNPTWIGVLRRSQETFYKRYFETCSKAFTAKNKASLLDELWNVAW